MKCELGAIVQSTAGRDKNKFFVVSKIISNEYVLLVDGKNKKLAFPKKKKIKHLIVYEQSKLKEKFEQEQYVLDSEIRQILKNFKVDM
jgi:ribosomal protein L14E/L6E/L27E